jgi:D-ribose pyranose/furanose isomerase RbsD
MAKLIPAAERVVRARQLIQEAREFPIPPEMGKNDLSYIAGIKDLLRQARDMIKFIPQTAGVSAEMKEDVKKIYEEIEQANRDILYTA